MPDITGRHLGTWSHDLDVKRVYIDECLADYVLVQTKRSGQGCRCRSSWRRSMKPTEAISGRKHSAIAERRVLDISLPCQQRFGARVVRVVGRCFHRDDDRPFLFGGATFDATPGEGALIQALVASGLDGDEDRI